MGTFFLHVGGCGSEWGNPPYEMTTRLHFSSAVFLGFVILRWWYSIFLEVPAAAVVRFFSSFCLMLASDFSSFLPFFVVTQATQQIAGMGKIVGRKIPRGKVFFPIYACLTEFQSSITGGDHPSIDPILLRSRNLYPSFPSGMWNSSELKRSSSSTAIRTDTFRLSSALEFTFNAPFSSSQLYAHHLAHFCTAFLSQLATFVFSYFQVSEPDLIATTSSVL